MAIQSIPAIKYLQFTLEATTFERFELAVKALQVYIGGAPRRDFSNQHLYDFAAWHTKDGTVIVSVSRTLLAPTTQAKPTLIQVHETRPDLVDIVVALGARFDRQREEVRVMTVPKPDDLPLWKILTENKP